MKKPLIFFLIFALLITTAYANPQPTNNNTVFIFAGILGILTLGAGFLVIWGLIQNEKVEFLTEEVNITIGEQDSVYVEGVYHFARTGNSIKNYKIIYPFPQQKWYGKIELHSVTINNKPVEYYAFEAAHHDRISLDLWFNADHKCDLQISFTQYPATPCYKYILKSTRLWKKELETSIINVSLPDSRELISNYPELVFLEKEDNRSEFRMTRQQFYPEKDLILNW